MSGPVLDLEGRVALVTGGSRGIGRAVARMLAGAGASVAIAYRARRDEADAAVREVTALGGRALAHGADLAREEAAGELFDRVEGEFGGVDLFVGNHGIWPPDDVPIARMETEQWRRTLEVNLDSLFYLSREAARRVRDEGRIVLVSSTAGQRGEAYHADYAASKGAVISFVKSLCLELAPRGITVNAVAPGWVDTDMAEPALGGPDLDGIRASIPLGRVATAEDVAGPIVFLCSPLARHVTGEILNVNGGAVRVG